MTGLLGLNKFDSHSLRPGSGDNSLTVRTPSQWDDIDIKGVLDPSFAETGQANAWLPDGTFAFPSLEVVSENPVDFVGLGGLSGVGFCESVGSEPVEAYRLCALKYIQNA